MKIAVISDIHGNIDALEAVEKDIKKEGCEKIFVLGDYAMAGAEPSLVINWFIEKKYDNNYKMIQGNTDLMIANYSSELYESLKEKAPIMAEALKNNILEISEEQKNFLKNLPTQIELIESGVKFLLVHGSPRRNNEDISPNLKLEQIEEMLENVDADVILCGHTHLPCGYSLNSGKTVINVGSVGRSMTPDKNAVYLQLTIDKNGKFFSEHKIIKYDNEKVSRHILARGFKHCEDLAKMYVL